MTERPAHNLVSASFQAIAFLVSFAIISTLFGIRYKMFIINDPTPILHTNEPSEKTIQVGLHIAHFSDFDVIHNKFTLDGTLWFAYDPNQISIDMIKQFGIFNGALLHSSAPIILDHSEITKIAQFRVRVEFHTSLNYRMYPFDDHRVNLIITNDLLPDDIIFQSSKKNLTFDSSLFVPGWRMVKESMQAGYKQVVLEKDSKQYVDKRQEAIVSLYCERSDPGVMINILLTLLVILFISILTFSSSEDSVLIVTVSLVALIGYRAIMQDMTPPHVSYFMFSDFLYLLTLTCIITALFSDIMTRDGSNSKKTKRCCIVGIYGFFIISCAIIMLIR